MIEKEELLYKILRELAETIPGSKGRTIKTLLAKYKILGNAEYITEVQIDTEMKQKVPSGRECLRCPFLKESICTFLEIFIFKESKMCNYNL
jgi:hypothetical protein